MYAYGILKFFLKIYTPTKRKILEVFLLLCLQVIKTQYLRII